MRQKNRWTMEDYRNNQIDYGQNFELLYEAWIDSRDSLLTEEEREIAARNHKNYLRLERLLDQQDRAMRLYLKIDESPVHKYPNGMQSDVCRILRSGKHTVNELLEKMIKKPNTRENIYRIISDLKSKSRGNLKMEVIEGSCIKRYWMEAE